MSDERTTSGSTPAFQAVRFDIDAALRGQQPSELGQEQRCRMLGASGEAGCGHRVTGVWVRIQN
jgi:hypothetical protein